MNVGEKHISEEKIHLLQSLINIIYTTTLQYVGKMQEVD
jgi:hypothetical protein